MTPTCISECGPGRSPPTPPAAASPGLGETNSSQHRRRFLPARLKSSTPTHPGNSETLTAPTPRKPLPHAPVNDIVTLNPPTTDDAVLYLWAVNSRLLEAIQVMAE
jgi:hypothetical protein